VNPNISPSVPGVSQALEAYKMAIASALDTTVRKDLSNSPGYTSELGLQARSLDAPAKLLYALTAILRRMIPRVTPKVVSQLLEWKVITAINTSGNWGSAAQTGVPAANRKTEKDKSARLKQISALDYTTFDAQIYGQDYQDVRALAVLQLLQTLMVMEEDIIIGGRTVAILTPPAAPTGVVAAGGGLAADTYRLKVSALTLQGYRQSQIAGYNPNTNTAGEALPSATSVGEVAALNDMITYSWADVKGAVAYNMWVQQGGAGTYKYSGTVTVNRFVLTSVSQIGTPVENTVDGSQNALDFDGVLTQYVEDSDLQVQYSTLNNGSLTSDGLGGVTQLTDAMQAAYLATGVGPTVFMMEPRLHRKIISLIAGATAPAWRINLNGNDGNMEAKGGLRIASVLNPFTGEDVEIVSHRTFPKNMIIGPRMTNPYDYSNVGSAMEMAVARDYYQIDYSVTAADAPGSTVPGGPVWPFSVRANEVLKIYFGGGGVVLKNVSEA
jgi:hypothetical protein